MCAEISVGSIWYLGLHHKSFLSYPDQNEKNEEERRGKEREGKWGIGREGREEPPCGGVTVVTVRGEELINTFQYMC